MTQSETKLTMAKVTEMEEHPCQSCYPDGFEQVAQALIASQTALRESMKKRHEYGMWIARLEAEKAEEHQIIIASHSDPIERCQSPGCVKARAALLEQGEGDE